MKATDFLIVCERHSQLLLNLLVSHFYSQCCCDQQFHSGGKRGFRVDGNNLDVKLLVMNQHNVMSTVCVEWIILTNLVTDSHRILSFFHSFRINRATQVRSKRYSAPRASTWARSLSGHLTLFEIRMNGCILTHASSRTIKTYCL